MSESSHRFSALIVDDDRGVGAAVKDVLLGLDCRATVAESFDEAIRAFRSGPTHFSILDVHVRDRTGFEILRELRTLREGHEAIFMSGAITEETRRRALDFAAYSLLSKPLRPGELRDAVGGLMGSGRLTRL
jgi:DNA-binding response OmpR family regulator